MKFSKFAWHFRRIRGTYGFRSIAARLEIGVKRRAFKKPSGILSVGGASSRLVETDAIIEEVLATATVALDVDRDKAVYEVGDWSSAMQTSLATSLLVAEIPYEWDELGDLLVYADDEEAVDAILEAMPDPDDSERALDEEVDVPDVLTSAWHAASQLVKDPVHSEAVVNVAEAADTLEHVRLPFGFEPAVWRNIVDRACALRDGLAGGDEPDEEPWTDDQVIEVAEVLRDAIRPFL